ncbi:MAG: phenylalanine--tRNA ligase subunit beta [bacterium]|nr:phenylalanine--tRNA ligase subunit beta [bacterium]
MRFSYLWLKELTTKIPPPQKVEELLTMHSFQVEGVSKAGKDHIFDIDILPNRTSDCSGHIGVAREISVLAGGNLKLPKNTIKTSKTKIADKLSLSLTSKATKRYVAGMMEGVSIKASSKKIGDRLASCGMRPINSIVDATNYLMLETGHPAHAFDYDKLEGHKIDVRPAKKGEIMETLDGQKFTLTPKDIVIADAKGPIAIAGIKGGKRCEIDNNTKTVVFEVASFDRTHIRRTSREIGLATDASIRFSRGIPSTSLDTAMMRLLALASETSGGTAAMRLLDEEHKPIKHAPVLVHLDYVNRLLGVDIKESESLDILKKLGFLVTKDRNGIYKVTPPEWRMDIVYEEDVSEEIGRVYGYDKIKPEVPHAPMTHVAEDPEHALLERIRDHFVARGFTEVQNYSFEPREGLFHEADTKGRVEIENPISEEYSHLRPSLVPGLIKNIEDNIAHIKDPRFIEVGKVFRMGSKKPQEEMHVAAVMVGHKKDDGMFFRAKGVVETFFEELGVSDVWFDDKDIELGWPMAPKSMFHPYRSAYIGSSDARIGAVYQVHPTIDLDLSIIVVELAVPELVHVVEDQIEFTDIPKYPASLRDIGILVNRDVRVDDVVRVIETAGGELLVDSDLFDYYEGDNLGPDEKSFAFHLVFQSSKKTLTDKEVSESYSNIEKAVLKEGWTIRE